MIKIKTGVITYESEALAEALEAAAKQAKFVSRRALEARVNRALIRDGQRLRRCCPGDRRFEKLGRYYTISAATDEVDCDHVDLEGLALALEVMQPDEVLDD